jgi:hypothetical protein
LSRFRRARIRLGGRNRPFRAAVAPVTTMTSLKDKVRKALQETRILVLGTQILLGFKFQAALRPGFDALQPHGRLLEMSALALLLATFTLLIVPTPFHRISEGGDDTARMHRVTTIAATAALLPLALALALDFFVPVEKAFGLGAGLAVALVMGGAALFLWYGLELLRRSKGPPAMKGREQPAEKTPLKDKISQILTEARIILPGAQALLGFQLVAYFSETFEKLPQEPQLVHTAGTMLIGLTVLLLMAPAAYHRIVDDGEDTPDFDRIATRMVIAALVPLALGLSCEIYVVLMKVWGNTELAILLAAGAGVTMIGVWLGFPLAMRAARPARRGTEPARASR